MNVTSDEIRRYEAFKKLINEADPDTLTLDGKPLREIDEGYTDDYLYSGLSLYYLVLEYMEALASDGDIARRRNGEPSPM